MQNEHNITQELKEIAPAVEAVGNHNIYTVPADYFNGLAGQILLRINQPALVKPTFTVPAGFFDNLSESIMQKVRAAGVQQNDVFAELQEVAPLLNSIGKTNLYTVPSGFFENFRVQLPVEQAKLVQMPAKRSWLKYAAAAVIAGVMVTGGYVWLKTDNSYPDKFQGMAKLDVPKEISTVADDDIIQYLDHQPVTSDIASASYEEQAPDVNQFIENASSEEIQQYLDENAEPGEKDSKGI